MTSPLIVRDAVAAFEIALSDWDGVLDVRSARITLDEAWVPYAQAELVVALPPSEDVLIFDRGGLNAAFATRAAMNAYFSTNAEVRDVSNVYDFGRPTMYVDPRENRRVTITLHQEWLAPVRPTQTRVFDLQLRERVVDHNDGTMTLKFASDEAALLDRALVANEPDSSALAFYGSLRAIVNHVLGRYGASLQPGSADASFASNLDALVQQPGVSDWNFIQPLVQASGLRLFCDELRKWWLVDAEYSVPGQIQIAEAVNLTRGEDVISRSDSRNWYDSVVVRYSWTYEDGTAGIAYDSAGANPSTKTYRVDWNTPYPGAGAAAAILARAQGRGRTLSLEALPDYDATPGKRLMATLPNTPLQSGVVSSVEWVVAAEGTSDTMRVGSRGLIDTPANAWLLALGPWSAATGSWTAATGTN